MKEYATLITDDVSSPYSVPVFSRRRTTLTDGQSSRIERLCQDGWEVIDACTLPKLSTHDAQPRFAFILERTVAEGTENG